MDESARMICETQRSLFIKICMQMSLVYGNLMVKMRLTPRELQDIQDSYSQERFPLCIECADFMKINCNNCPAALKGQYYNTKYRNLATISVEAR